VRGRPVLAMVAAGMTLTAVLLAVGLSIRFFPTEASKQAGEVRRLFDVLIIASVPIFSLVVTVVITAVIRFRMRPGQEKQDGPPIHGNTRLEAFWTAIPATIIVSLIVYSYVVLLDIERAPSRSAQPELSVDVLGRQFAWAFTYPSAVTHGRPVTTPQLWLPEGRSVRFNIRSADVIHALWVPNFSVQEDAVPGLITHYRITPNRLGTYPVVCNELCGLGHAFMRSSVHVVTPAQFRTWLGRQQPPSSTPARTP
jgi:cytochrome c oxidase subunit II